jgi:septal ring factor EnvC (AmiA/AmiB activator)
MKRGRGNPKTMSSTVHGIVAGLALPALAAVCPEALAQDRVGAMESKLRRMEQEMNALQRELGRLRAADAQQEQSIQSMETQNAAQRQEFTDRVTKVEEAPGKRTMKNLVF